MDVFWVLTLLSLAAIQLALSLRKVKLGDSAPAAHGRIWRETATGRDETSSKHDMPGRAAILPWRH